MTNAPAATNMHYDPSRLLDVIAERLDASSDAILAQRLNLSRSVLRLIRDRRMPVSASLLMWIEEATGFSVEALRDMLGDRRHKIRPRNESSAMSAKRRSAETGNDCVMRERRQAR